MLATLLATAAIAQAPSRITVAVAIQDSAADGVIQSALSSAFRQLGDVDVVGQSERSDYTLHGVALCTTTPCSSTLNYVVALFLAQPLDTMRFKWAATVALPSSMSERDLTVDSLTTLLSDMFAGYEKPTMIWVTNWGRDRYEAGAKSIVRTIDAECFDRQRAFRRMLSSPDSNAAANYARFLRSRSWIC
jgi:hypothetical protein